VRLPGTWTIWAYTQRKVSQMRARLRFNRTTPEPSQSSNCAFIKRCVVGIALLIGSTGASWSEQKIGTTEIVINTVEGTVTSVTTPLNHGDAVYRDEGVRSRVDSKAGLLMEDKTAVTIGPSSTIKLDRFVYAGPKTKGTIVINLALGTARLVIGDANKHSYTILTPTSAIGVRD
jgi:hypothetical protein